MNTDPKPGDTRPTERQRPGDAGKLNAGEGTRGPDKRAGDAAPPRRTSAEAEDLNAEAAKDSNSPIGGVHFSAPFIKRPVATFLLSIAIILAGAVAYRMLPVASLPEVEFPVISVGAGLPGADPETMASAVATPLERQFSRIAGVNQMTSTSSIGSCSITLQFDLSRDINGAARDVQAAISAARAQLPANLPSNPTYRKINPADAPIMILALTSSTLTVPQLYDAADSILAQKLASVAGVGQTFVGGSSKPAVRIEANPQQLTSYNLSLNTLAAAAQTFNVLEPTGYLNGNEQRWSIGTTDQLFGADAYRPLVVATGRGPVTNVKANNGLQANVASATAGAAGAGTSNSGGSGSANGNGTSTAANSTGTVASTGTAAGTAGGGASNVTAPTTAATKSGQGYTSAAINTNTSNVSTTSMPAARHRPRGRRGAGRQLRGRHPQLWHVQRPCRSPGHRLQVARRQRHPDGRQHREAAAHSAGVHPAQHQAAGCTRPYGHNPRQRSRHHPHHDADHRPGHPGGLLLPA